MPILVGSLKPGEGKDTEDAFGRVMAQYLDSDENLFVISSDFCHWGSRFNFTWHKPSESGGDEIWESVEYLDRKGMSLIEAVDGSGFQEYSEFFNAAAAQRVARTRQRRSSLTPNAERDESPQVQKHNLWSPSDRRPVTRDQALQGQLGRRKERGRRAK